MKTLLILTTLLLLFSCEHQDIALESSTSPDINNIALDNDIVETPILEAVDLDLAEQEWIETPEVDFGSDVDTELPNILVIGDSISIGYTGALEARFQGQYDVFHPADNCRNSYFTLENIDRWLSMEMYASDLEVIVWNNGVWDSVFMDYPIPEDAEREWYGITIEQYEENLIGIANKMMATGKRIIFLTTTDLDNGPFRAGMELEMNEVAFRVLPELGIEVYDLYEFSLDIENKHPESDVHFTREANWELSGFIVDKILNE